MADTERLAEIRDRGIEELETARGQLSDDAGSREILFFGDEQKTIGISIDDVLDVLKTRGEDQTVAFPYLMYADATGSIQKRRWAGAIQMFIGHFLWEIRRKICKNANLGHVTTGALASLAVWIVEHFGIDSHTAMAVAAAVIVMLSAAGKKAFCKMSDQQLRELFPDVFSKKKKHPTPRKSGPRKNR